MDHLGVLLQYTGPRAMVDVDRTAAVWTTIGRANHEVIETVTVDVPQTRQRQAETSAIAFAVPG